MRLNSSHLASILAGAGLAAPGLTFGAWAFRDMPEGIALMDRPGLTVSLLLLLIAPVFILGFGVLGRVVLAYLEQHDREHATDAPRRRTSKETGRPSSE
jgi:hypothetical protein